MKIAFQLKHRLPRLLLWRTCGALSCEKHEKHEKHEKQCMKPQSRTHQTALEAPNPATLQRVVVSAGGVEIIVHSNNGGADGSISATSADGCSSGVSGVSAMLAAVGGTKCGKSPAKIVT